MSPKSRRGLGKGLGALIPSGGSSPGLRKVHIDAIVPNPHQPRSTFDQEALEELAASIREVGLIQPLIVQEIPAEDPTQPPRYQLITGERRWRAARLAGLEQVDVILKEATPQELLELALIENIQRADLNPLEEAAAYQQLAEEFGLTQERIAERVGRSRASVANTMRLLRLPQKIKDALLANQITEGHARALLMLDDPKEQLEAFAQVLEKGLSVRQTEELVRRRRARQAPKAAPPRQRTRSPETEALEREFREALGTKVDLYRSRKGGRLVIHFYSEEELQALYDRLVGDQ
ncbi:MAG: ParB/RepB/Spo0J family partition protein [Anaerolineae bacterium]|nr:ParB/RepB/Spo0J family partition protein [Anaerolineae bacterium]